MTVEQRPAGRRRAQRIAILGAGAGGICTAIELQRAGWRDFAIFEKAAGVGGTWWHNRYPGAECDVESHLYSFSFEPKLDWTRPYAGQAEIQAYLAHCVAKYGLAPHLRLCTEVRRAIWDEARAAWRLETAGGEAFEADVVVSAIGMFNELHEPEIPGLDAFRGTRFHSARWNHAHDLAGEAVAVIGSAASAVQFVPEIAKQVGRLHLFQRSANWVLPKDDTPFTPEQLERFATDPSAARERREQIRQRIESLITFSDPELMRSVEEACLRNLEAVRDPSLRRRLTPTEPYGCKRPLLTNYYYPTFNRTNVELVTAPIERITADAVVTSDGRARRIDALILATGFETTKFLSAIDVRGRGGLRIEDAWKDGAQAYLGVATAGFPNLFMLYGPNTNNGSILFMLECQVACALRQLARLDDERLAWLEVRRSAMDRYNADLQRDIERVSVWQTGCHTYYRSANGRIVTQWPHTMAEFQARTSRPDRDAWDAEPALASA